MSPFPFFSLPGGDGVRVVGGVTAIGAGRAAGRAALGGATAGVLACDLAIDIACLVDGLNDIKDAAEKAKKTCCQPPGARR